MTVCIHLFCTKHILDLSELLFNWFKHFFDVCCFQKRNNASARSTLDRPEVKWGFVGFEFFYLKFRTSAFDAN